MINKAKLPHFKLTDYKRLTLLLILLAAIILRFWKVPELFFFGIDEEYQSLLALTIVKHFHIIWIGLSAANTGFYVGPLVVYIHAFLLLISKLDPVILGYAGSLMGVLTVAILFFSVKNLFGQTVALISTILYTFSVFIIFYDRRFWNTTFVPIVSILMFVALVKSLNNQRWHIVIAILLGISFHINASLFMYVPLTIILIFIRWIQKKLSIDIKTASISLFAFLSMYSPLIVFDLVHNFDNLKTPLRMLNNIGKGTSSTSIIDHLVVMRSALTHFYYNNSLSDFTANLLLVMTTIILSWFLLKKKSNTEKILALIVSVYMVVFLLYPGPIQEYYYLGFMPFLMVILSIFLKQFNKILLSSILFIFITINVITFVTYPVSNGLLAKKVLIQKTSTFIGNKIFYLTTEKSYINFGGWRYLFEAYGKKPNSSNADSMFGWIYPNEIINQKPELTVIINDGDIKVDLDKKPVKIIKSDSFVSYVVKNK